MRSDSFDKRGSGKNGFPQPRFLVVKSSYIVIASDPALAGERGNLQRLLRHFVPRNDTLLINFLIII